MTRTVDLVISGDSHAARAAAVDALRCRRRVLIVLRSDDVREAQRLGRCLRKAAGAGSGRLLVMAGADVVCVDGVDGVEAVVIRHARTGHLSAVNSSAFTEAADGTRTCSRDTKGDDCSRAEGHDIS